jgi:probable phosphoglycerate mutase
MRVIFIRHGQSTANAGAPCDDIALIGLTERGWQQATHVAEQWTDRPSLIITSPFLRTQQTASPTIEKFPDVRVEIWPIQEFTYLQPARWTGTLSSERLPHIEHYWASSDPTYCDGEGAESFATLLRRAEATLNQLAALPHDALVYVFSHGQYMQAIRSLVLDSDLTDQEKMRKFWKKDEHEVIKNVTQLKVRKHGNVWHIDSVDDCDYFDGAS